MNYKSAKLFFFGYNLVVDNFFSKIMRALLLKGVLSIIIPVLSLLIWVFIATFDIYSGFFFALVVGSIIIKFGFHTIKSGLIILGILDMTLAINMIVFGITNLINGLSPVLFDKLFGDSFWLLVIFGLIISLISAYFARKHLSLEEIEVQKMAYDSSNIYGLYALILFFVMFIFFYFSIY